jgi:hypothetical protein
MIAIANNIQRSKTLLNPEYQKMAFRREPFYGCGEFDLRNGEEEEMGYEDLLSTW